MPCCRSASTADTRRTKLGRSTPGSFFDEIVAVMRRSERFVPLFNDKHLSYRWDWAKEMADTAANSASRSWREAPCRWPSGFRRSKSPPAPVQRSQLIHGGGVEDYDFHALETLQSMIEFRKGGETGISQIEVLYGEEFWKGEETGKWPFDLAAAAVELEIGKRYVPRTLPPNHGWTDGDPHAFIITYKDGLKGYVLKLGGYPMRWQFACRLKGESQIRTTQFYGGTWILHRLARRKCD